jgi:hypothetical protein
MTRTSVVRHSGEGAHARDLRTPGTAEGRSGSENRPKTDKG